MPRSLNIVSSSNLKEQAEFAANRIADINLQLENLKGQLEVEQKRHEVLLGAEQAFEKFEADFPDKEEKSTKDGRSSISSRESSGGRKTFNNQTPLKEVIRKILSSSRKPLSAVQVAEEVKKSGYKTKSKEFGKIVYLTLLQMVNTTKEVQKTKDDDRTLVYRLSA